MSSSKKSQFDTLVSKVDNCSLCPRMVNRKKVLSHLNGSLDSAILFIAEAPGRLGADKYGIPLYGDQTGRNFDKLLGHSGLNRDSIFITNAVLCNPRSQNGNNDSPSISEIHNCSQLLKATINIIKPEIIATLGAKALIALRYIYPHDIRLSKNVAGFYKWLTYKVFPLYHPGPMALIRRPINQQIKDYKELAREISL